MGGQRAGAIRNSAECSRGNTLLASDWYAARLAAKQKIDRRLWQRHVDYLDTFSNRASHADEAARLGIAAKLERAKKTLRSRIVGLCEATVGHTRRGAGRGVFATQMKSELTLERRSPTRRVSAGKRAGSETGAPNFGAIVNRKS